MNKEAYIKELQKKLKRLPSEELEDVIQYYREYFEDAGISDDEDVLKVLDSPSNIASDILSEYAFKEFETPETKGKNGIRTIWFVILAIFAAPIALPLAVAAVAVIFAIIVVVIALAFAFLVVTVSFIGAGIFALIAGFAVMTQSISTTILAIGMGLMLISLGVLVMLLLNVIIPKVLSFISKLAKTLLNKFNNKNK